MQGIGWALNEEYRLDEEGRMMNSTFLDYRMPTALDLPMIDTVIVEVANAGHPYGVRGVGEAPIIPVMAAVANAVYHAVGVRLNELPMSPGPGPAGRGEKPALNERLANDSKLEPGIRWTSSFPLRP